MSSGKVKGVIAPKVSTSGIPSGLTGAARWLLRKMAIHENVTTGKNLRVGRGVVVSSPHGLSIGDSVSIGPHTTIQVDGVIGDFVLIGMNVQIAGREDHAIDQIGTPIGRSTWVGDRPPNDRDAVYIGTDVWIGGHSTVLSGVRIGDGAIVGAASVVTRDVEPFQIVAGVPARPVGERFASAEDRVEHLAQLEATLGVRTS